MLERNVVGDVIKTKHALLLFLFLVLIGSTLSLPHINFNVAQGTTYRIPAEQPWVYGFDHRVRLGIRSHHWGVGATDFPLLVVIDGSAGYNNDDVTFIFDEVGNNFQKIAFTTSDQTTQMYAEVEYWNAANERAYIWVCVPSISDSETTYIYLYYDGDAADNTEYIGDTNSEVAERVWVNEYVLVSHLEDVDASNVADSTSRDNDGVKEGLSNPIQVTLTDSIGSCQLFTDDFINFTTTGTDTSVGYVSLWAQRSGDGGANDEFMFKCRTAATNNRIYLLVKHSDNNDIYAGFGNDGNIDGNRVVSDDTWYHFGLRWSGADYVLYRNGAARKSGTSSALPSVDPAAILGDYDNTGQDFYGYLDEVRILNHTGWTQNEILSWIAMEYRTGIDTLIDWEAEDDRYLEKTFTCANALDFSGTYQTGRYLWLNKSYSFKRVTGFRLEVHTEPAADFAVRSWFNTDDSEAQLRVSSTANVNFSVYSPNFESASAIGCISYTYSAQVITILAADGNLVTIYGTYGSTDANEFTPENYAFEITDMEGCGPVLFTEAGYYTFQAQFWDGDSTDDIDTGQLRFSDGAHTMQVAYDHVSGLWSVVSGAGYIHLRSGTVTELDMCLLQVTYLISLQGTVIDASDVDVEIWCNDTSGNTAGWETIEADYFDIYSLGGTAEYRVSGSGARVTGGDVFELQVGPGTGVVEANATFLNLQHLHFLVHWKGETDWDGYCDVNETNTDTLEYGIWICYNDVWIREWHCVLDIVSDSRVNEGLGWNFVLVNVTWYHRNTLIDYDVLSVLHEGENTDHDWMRLWVDFWFNKINGSTTIGGRVTSYYYGMNDTNAGWIAGIFGGTWFPHFTDSEQSMFFADLEDNSGNVISCKDVEMMKVWARVNGSSGLNQVMSVEDYDIFSITTLPNIMTMEGIDTPIFISTKVVDMPTTDFLGALLAGIRGALMPVTDSLFLVWEQAILTFMGAMDTIFGYAGWEGGFTWLSTQLTTFFSYIGTSMTSVTQMLAQVMVIFGDMTTPLAEVLTITGNMITYSFRTITDTITWAQASLNYGLTNYGLLGWTDELGNYHVGLIEGMLILLGICLPLIELNRMRDKGFTILFEDLNRLMNVASFVVSIGLRVVSFFITLVTTILESIPVVE